ncbi:hypothetical protein EV652_102237 [Kribbella steppae]|uniref:Antibiotic biosynthesis monooxygenase n=1 Tax=Kribbella steppae TaxID=2512223 RepID=A0A4R2HSF0_9ACTN|nr:hypothetical protein [Kribbella steppae]TCO34172.1 hypothetical protein EV652_102237 [Kribbella steppae]
MQTSQQLTAERDTVVAAGVVRIHTYAVDPADRSEFLKRRATVIDLIRAAHPGLTSTRLLRLEDGTYTDTWSWDSFQTMAAAFPMAQSPEAGAAWALTTNAAAANGEVVDEH